MRAAGLLALGLIGCSTAKTAPDALPADSDADVVLDSGSKDSAADSGFSDVGADIPEGGVRVVTDPHPFFPGRWSAIPAYDCPAISLDPELVAPPLRWKACKSGRAGCEELDMYWALSDRQPGGAYLGFAPSPATRWRGKEPFLFYSRSQFNTTTREGALIGLAESLTTHKTVVGRTFKMECSIQPRAIGDTGSVWMSVPAKYRYSASFLPDNDPNKAITRTFKSGDVDDLKGGMYDLQLSRDEKTIIVQATVPESFVFLDLPKLNTRGRSTRPLLWLNPIDMGAIGGELTGDTDGLGISTLDGVSDRIRDAPKLRSVNGVFVDHQTETVVWAEVEEAGSNPRFYKSPVPTATTKLSPTYVGRYVSPMEVINTQELVSMGGVVLSLVDEKLAFVADLATGNSWTIPVEEGLFFKRPITADETWVWFAMNDRPRSSGGNTFVRYRRDSLGAPKPRLAE